MSRYAPSTRFLTRAWMLSAAVSATALFVACDAAEERFERIEKLRALGVTTTPLVAEPSTAEAPRTTTLAVHVATPKGVTVTAEAYTDEGSSYGIPATLTIDPAPPTVAEHAAFDIVSLKATLAIPDASLLANELKAGFARVRYGLKVKAGDQDELIVGTVLVYPSGAAELAWNTATPSVAITSPGAGGAVGGEKQELKGQIGNQIGEPMRVAWYVSTGELANRRAKETTWKTDGKGTRQTVIFTVRGTKSGSFAYQAIDVSVE